VEGWRVTPSDREALGEVMEMPSTYGCPLVMTNIAMEAMAHRNRWFTQLENGDFP
jgi:hypothetical protein